MLKTKSTKAATYDVGVIVGRFQTATLHQAHLDLIRSVVSTHARTIIFLGLAPVTPSARNPLDFESRKSMILNDFPDVTICYIKDMSSDKEWSMKLDEEIGDLVPPTQTVGLYGSRDSFIEHYTGKYPTVELETQIYCSASEERKKIGKKTKNSEDFRKGVIFVTQNAGYPTVISTVDAAIIDMSNKRILLGRKRYEDKYRFIGGFAQTDSDSFEQDIRREISEEAGRDLSIGQLDYIGSYNIDDWRYRNEIDKIRTHFYAAHVSYGRPEAGDDIAEVRWFGFDEFWNADVNGDINDTFILNNIVEEHDVLFYAMLQYLRKQNNS